MGATAMKKFKEPTFLGESADKGKYQTILEYFYINELQPQQSDEAKFEAFSQMMSANVNLKRAVDDTGISVQADEMCSMGGFFD